MWQSSDVPIPALLEALIASGRWTDGRVRRLDLPIGTVRAIAPEDHQICLMPAPFHPVSRDNPGWFEQFRARGDIDDEQALIIADFGAGSDTAIVLDLRADPACVRALVFRDGGAEWELIAETFDDFARMLGLTADTDR